MNFVNRHLFAASALLSAAGLALAATSTLAAEATFVQHQSRHSFSGTISALKKSVSNNGMMVMGQVDQGKVLGMTGLHLQGQSFLVGNPTIGKEVFGMNPAVGAVLPLRVYVWQNAGHAYVGYFEPSGQLTAIDGKLAKPGAMMDHKFAAILTGATE